MAGNLDPRLYVSVPLAIARQLPAIGDGRVMTRRGVFEKRSLSRTRLFILFFPLQIQYLLFGTGTHLKRLEGLNGLH